jgi:hypothetical protein
MRTYLKYAAALALTGALAVAAATPSEARHGRNAAAAGIGFVAGALLGAAAAANSGYYDGPGFYYGPSYYGPGDYDAGPYAYEPAPIYVQPAPRRYYRSGGGGCWHVTDADRGYGYYGACY